MHENVIASIKSDAMAPVQIIAVAMCVVINMLDGFDVLVMAFTAPEIAREWQLEPQSLGILCRRPAGRRPRRAHWPATTGPAAGARCRRSGFVA